MQGYRADVDGLRMIAVLPVVLNHAGIPGFPGGFIGVDIFFVISGYLITRILAREIDEDRFSILSFYERRARRILPALFVVMAACLVAGWWLLSPQRYEGLGKSIIATLTFSSNIWFWQSAGDYFGSNVEFEPLLHTWSLAVEEQFYLFFPLLLWAIAGLERRYWIAIIWVLVAASFALSLWMTQAAPTANFYLVPTRAWELGAGSLLALGAFPTARHRGVHEAAGWAGLVLIAGSIFLISAQTPFPGLAALPSVLGATLVIFAGTGHAVFSARLLSWRPFVWVGLISYSLYLWHWPILVAARRLHFSTELPLLTAGFCVLLSLFMGWLSWRYIERPFRATRGPKSMSAVRIFSLSGAGIAVLGMLSGFVVLNSGVIGQFSQTSLEAYHRAVERDPLDKACMNTSVGGAKGVEPCVIGAPAVTPRLVVWGDSHGGAALPGFDIWLRDKGMSALAYTKSACPPLLGVWRVDMGPNHDCDGHNAAVLADIAQAQGIETVILVARWSLATEGARAQHEAGETAILAVSGGTAVDPAGNADLVKQGLNDLIGALRAQDIDVFIVRGTPEIGVDVPDIMLSQGDEVSDKFRPSRQAVDHRNMRADRIIDSIAEQQRAAVLSPKALLCSDKCIIQSGGEALYRDDDHLSAFGARWLVPKLMQQVAFE